MIRNLKIEHRISRDSLGETDDDYAQRYVVALAAALKTEYPEADIEVNLRSDFCNASQTFINADWDDFDMEADVRENIDVIGGLVWDQLDY